MKHNTLFNDKVDQAVMGNVAEETRIINITINHGKQEEEAVKKNVASVEPATWDDVALNVICASLDLFFNSIGARRNFFSPSPPQQLELWNTAEASNIPLEQQPYRHHALRAYRIYVAAMEEALFRRSDNNR